MIFRRFSVRGKLLLPVLGSLLALIVVQTLFRMDHDRINNEASERNLLEREYREFCLDVQTLENVVATLAGSIADRPRIIEAMGRMDRQTMRKDLSSVFRLMQTQFGIAYLYIHRTDGYVFLRVHQPDFFGDESTSYRQSLRDAAGSLHAATGIESDPNGLGIRGVSPIVKDGRLLGLVEVGINCDSAFIETMKRQRGGEYTLWLSYETAAPSGFWNASTSPASPPLADLFVYAHTGNNPVHPDASAYESVLQTGRPLTYFVTSGNDSYAILLGPLHGYGGRTIGIVEIRRSREAALANLRRLHLLTLEAAGAVTLLAVGVILLTLHWYVLRPLRHLSGVTSRQLNGELDARVQLLPHDEYGQLGRTFNQLSNELQQTLAGQRSTIQELSQAREALRQSGERLSITLNAIGDAVIATDTDGRIVRLNPAAETLIGLPWQDALGRPLVELFRLIVQETGLPAESPVEQVLRTKRPAAMKEGIMLVRRDGSECAIADSAAPILDDQGNLVGVVMVCRNVTEERLLQEQLRQSQKLEAIGQLAGGVAHDFNNLLTAILGHAELLQIGAHRDAAGIEMAAVEIRKAATRAAELTAQLLAFSRKSPMRRVDVDVNSIIRDTISILRRSIDPRIIIQFEASSEPSVISGDPGQLQNALINLAVNARDAMPHGGTLKFVTRHLSLDAENLPQGLDGLEIGRYVEVAVSDTGTGMDADTLKRIFEPFFTTREVGKGTGLGLASVYGCVKAHNGVIRVESEPGRGSTFLILLPASSEQAVEETPAPQVPMETGKGHVLVVDDDPSVRRLAESFLGNLGYRITTCNDGIRACEFIHDHAGEIDLILLDMVMPHRSGRDTYFILRKDATNVPVVIMSGFSRNETIEELLAEGAAGFIAKPFLVKDLADIVKRHIRSDAKG
jgi:PAS domain S-box-containing protein